ncbi:hypothetical protein JCM19239_4793 [Vibrio variabilis]|uniref:Uncharacterized protein n=1 Tax=Vibrio variabilis TaxID=990271 RepID=A0ABQ0JGH6_9VIBR|nr:hypothetical protein JCM19239_4793 [Vibrio variabilis]
MGCKEGSHLMVDVVLERCGPKLKKNASNSFFSYRYSG